LIKEVCKYPKFLDIFKPSKTGPFMVSPHKSKENEGKNPEKASEEKPDETDNKSKDKRQGKEIEALEGLVRQEKERAEELKGLLQRVQAEFENYIKRSEGERKAFQEVANAKLIMEFLPLLDSFDTALERLKKDGIAGQHKEAIHGIALLRRQLWQIMERNGMKELNSVGEKFDPEKHECLMFENHSDKEDGVVLEEIQKGFVMNGKIIRHAKVKVNKRS